MTGLLFCGRGNAGTRRNLEEPSTNAPIEEFANRCEHAVGHYRRTSFANTVDQSNHVGFADFSNLPASPERQNLPAQNANRF
jgi:hypothetical protein